MSIAAQAPKTLGVMTCSPLDPIPSRTRNKKVESLLLRAERVAVLAFVVILTTATAADDEKWRAIHPGGKADAKAFDFDVTDADVSSTPVWQIDSDIPPLLPRRAAEIAQKQLEQFVADRTKWKLREISLIDFGEQHWLYVVHFVRQYPPELAVFGGDYFDIPVLMSGAVLKPKITPLPPDRTEPAKSPNQSS